MLDFRLRVLDFRFLSDYEVQTSQQTRYLEPMLGQCWPIVYDAGPTLAQHWFKVSCLLGYDKLQIWNFEQTSSFRYRTLDFSQSLDNFQPSDRLRTKFGQTSVFKTVLAFGQTFDIRLRILDFRFRTYFEIQVWKEFRFRTYFRLWTDIRFWISSFRL